MSGPAPQLSAGRVGLNAAFMIGARLTTALIAVYQISLVFPALGVEHAGQYRAAISYCAIFTVFASMGIHRVLFRDIAKKPERAWPLVWAASALVLVFSGLTYGGLIGIFKLIDGDPDRLWAVVGAGLWVVLFWALQQPFEYLLMARERMAVVSVLNVLVSIMKIGAIYFFLGADPTSLWTHSLLAISTLIGLGCFVAAALTLEHGQWPQFQIRTMRSLFEASIPMSAILLFTMIYFNADLVILTRIQGDAAGGIYGLVRQVCEPVLMLSGVIGNALFPALCRYATGGEAQFTALRQSTFRLILLIAFPAAAGIAATAHPIVALLSREAFTEFEASVGVMRLMCLVIPAFYFNGVALEVFLSNHEHWFLVRVYAVAAVTSVALNILAASLWGVHGVVVVAMIIPPGVALAFAWRLRKSMGGLRLAGFLPRIVLACALMGVVAWYLSGIALLLAVVAGAIVYPALVLLLNPFDEREWRLIRGVTAKVLPRLN